MKMGGEGSRDARKRLTGGRPLSNDETYSPLSLSFNAVTFNGDGRTDRASLQRVTRLSSGDGRTDRASLQRATRLSSMGAHVRASILVRQYLLIKDLVLYCSYVHSKE